MKAAKYTIYMVLTGFFDASGATFVAYDVEYTYKWFDYCKQSLTPLSEQNMIRNIHLQIN